MELIIIYILAINLIGFLLMGLDKSRARAGNWRVPEKRFIIIAIMGGSAGVILGLRLFRHKTRHLKFTIIIPMILVLQVFIFLWLKNRGII
ncbi:MAG: DUF1294 domain-containing protein [Bacillota bacterium]